MLRKGQDTALIRATITYRRTGISHPRSQQQGRNKIKKISLEASRRLGAARLEYLKGTELLEDLRFG